MKVTGSGKPSALDEAGAVKSEKPEKPGRSFPAEGSAAARKAESRAAAAISKDFTSDLTAELRAGRLQPAEAMEKVMERVIDRQLGVNAPAPAREKLRAALQDAIDSDPLLAEKMRSLAG